MVSPPTDPGSESVALPVPTTKVLPPAGDPTTPVMPLIVSVAAGPKVTTPVDRLTRTPEVAALKFKVLSGPRPSIETPPALPTTKVLPPAGDPTTPVMPLIVSVAVGPKVTTPVDRLTRTPEVAALKFKVLS